MEKSKIISQDQEETKTRLFLSSKCVAFISDFFSVLNYRVTKEEKSGREVTNSYCPCLPPPPRFWRDK
jgi:hypothetical protein